MKKKLRVRDFGRGEKIFWGRGEEFRRNPNLGGNFFWPLFY